MVTVHTEIGSVQVPDWVVHIDSFRRWTQTPEFPEHGRIWWLGERSGST
jgi:hypothetical protein